MKNVAGIQVKRSEGIVQYVVNSLDRENGAVKRYVIEIAYCNCIS